MSPLGRQFSLHTAGHSVSKMRGGSGANAMGDFIKTEHHRTDHLYHTVTLRSHYIQRDMPIHSVPYSGKSVNKSTCPESRQTLHLTIEDALY